MSKPKGWQILIVCLLCTLPHWSSAQFNERFADKELSNAPPWTGTLDLFSVNKQYLQSNFPNKRSGYISTPLPFSDYAEWAFDCGLTFAATSTTYVQLFLISDSENPAQCANGYYLSLRSGIIALCRIKNGSSTTLHTISGTTISKPTAYQYKITRKKSEWTIQLFNGTTEVTKSSFSETQPITPTGYFSIFCALNSSLSLSGFSSQYIEVKKGDNTPVDPDTEPEEPTEPDPEEPDNPDETAAPISINTAITIDSITLRLILNRSANLSQLRVKLLDLDDSPQFTTTHSGNEIRITSQTPFTVGAEYTVYLFSVIDPTTGIATQCSKTFTYYPPILGDSPIRISELMINPNGVKGIPPVEYVEIYNATTQSINLSGYGLLYGDKRYIMPARTLKSGEYAVLTHEKNSLLFDHKLTVIPLLSFPTLNNTSKNIGLSNPARQTLQQFTYSNTWYGSPLFSQGGYSLECIDLKNPLNDATNWSASLAPEGGTPGKENSIARSNTDQSIARVLEISYPNDDQLRILFSKEMNIATLLKPDNFKFYSNKIGTLSTFASNAQPNEVTLFLNRPLERNDRNALSIEGVTCRSGIYLAPFVDYPIALPQLAQQGEVAINELLFNPKEGGCDYIELYNRSTHMIDISDIILASRNSFGEILSRKIISSDRIALPPLHYLLLAKDTAWVAKEYGNKGIQSFRKMTSIPTMNNKSGNIVLLNRSLEVIDEFNYDESLHSSAMKEKKGIALERLSAELPTQDPHNWGSASSANRYGTPGYDNSQRYEHKASDQPFAISPKLIVPGSGHRNDRLIIQYDLPTDEHWVDIQICTLSAYPIKTISNKSLLSGKGILQWDGKSDRGVRVRKGIYIVYIKTLNKKRIEKIYRYEVVVG